METCTAETGLLRKKPCGHASVTRCENCERALCAQHAVAQLSAAGKKSGKFMCAECDAARKAHEKNMAALTQKRPAAPPKPAAAPAKPAPAAAAKPAPAPEPSDGGIDFTPGGGAPKK